MALNTLLQLLSPISSSIVPYHLICFSTLLGTELFQTFVVTKVCHNALPRSAFTTLQKQLFPIYFRIQSLLLLLATLTYPPHGILSLVQKKGDAILFAVAGVPAVLNIMLYGPLTRQVMIERIHQGMQPFQTCTHAQVGYGTIDFGESVTNGPRNSRF